MSGVAGMQSSVTRNDLRLARQIAHAWFDLLWEEGFMTRNGAYWWLSEQMEMPFDECHFGNFDAGLCDAAIGIVEAKLIELRREEFRKSK